MNDNEDDDDDDDRRKKEFESDYSELRVEIAQWGTCRQTYFVWWLVPLAPFLIHLATLKVLGLNRMSRGCSNQHCRLV